MADPTLQEQIAAVNSAQENPIVLSADSAGQIARDDGTAGVQNPIAPEGRVTVFTANQINQNLETGTNSPVTTLIQSQATPPSPPLNITVDDSGATWAPTTPGVGAAGDDSGATSANAGQLASGAGVLSGDGIATKNATVGSIDNLFNEEKIVPQANVLDQYASYTYQASVYLMKPETFNAMVKSGVKSLNGAQLLFQSGGAPVGGRNPYFSNDYYIDKIELKSNITGKGTNAAHNVNAIKMTVIEPNGITLIGNLDRAVQSYIGTANKKQNFGAQLYLLVIKFYGYDDSGNLVEAGVNPLGSRLNPTGLGTAFVEKYYPMAITKIGFKVANKLVEYEIEAAAPQYQIAVGQSRGTIPYNVELSAMSVKDALAGTAEVATAGTSTSKAAATALTQDEARDQEGSSNPPSAPSNAAAAPSPKLTIRKGLIDALNQYQKDLVTRKIYTYPDEYSVAFVESSIEQAKLKKAGGDIKNTATAAGGTAKDKLDPSTDAVDPSSRILTVTAGSQIVQFIDQVVRNSTYIQDQQTTIVQEGTQKQVPNGSPGKNVAWFKINVTATPTKYDPKRNDYAYKITYTISPYRINQTNSNYFATPLFKGVHKQYNYWFTGQNTQVLSYEQTYNALYTYVLSGGSTDVAKTTDAKANYQPRSGQSSQGGDLRTNEAPANLADSLYNPGDLAKATLSIVGDPAWLQQGEASFAPPTKGNFNSAAFLPDGTINFESQEILFEIVINTPTDYDLSTGLMDPNQRDSGFLTTTQAKSVNQSYVYKATECSSEFVKGKFTQTLKGVLMPRPSSQTTATAAAGGRPTTTAGTGIAKTSAGSRTLSNTSSDTAGGNNIGISQSQADAQDLENGASQQDTNLPTDTVNQDPPISNPSPQPAGPADDPTSTGDVTPQDSLAPGEDIVNSDSSNNAAAQIIAQDD